MYLVPTEIKESQGDHARFTNHSNISNLSVVINQEISQEPYFIANQDIEIGEELTNNYTEFDESCKTFKPQWM